MLSNGWKKKLEDLVETVDDCSAFKGKMKRNESDWKKNKMKQFRMGGKGL